METIYFKKATQIVDKYHWIRQVTWAFEAVRKKEQKKFSTSYRIYFKRSKSLLSKPFSLLTEEQKQQVNLMLSLSATMASAHFLKEQFNLIFQGENPDRKQELLRKWIDIAEASDLKEFVDCANTLRRWYRGIVNSFSSPYTNGFTEGCNNKIKVIKRVSYGYRNFNRFRNRILHIFNA